MSVSQILILLCALPYVFCHKRTIKKLSLDLNRLITVYDVIVIGRLGQHTEDDLPFFMKDLSYIWQLYISLAFVVLSQ